MNNRPKLWVMNADFEPELADLTGSYRRNPSFAAFNRQLGEQLLWLAQPNDALLLTKPWSAEVQAKARSKEVRLVDSSDFPLSREYFFSPWGWTPSVIELGIASGTNLQPLPLEVVQKVNSKIFSLDLERSLGIDLPGTTLVANQEELDTALDQYFSDPEAKWVIKHPLGVAANNRILGRGPTLKSGYATWVERQFSRQQKLILQPWLEVVHEFGTIARVSAEGKTEVIGWNHPKTNRAGAVQGYQIGPCSYDFHFEQLKELAIQIGSHLFASGYFGPFGFDSLVHRNGLHPLLEINARYTMGFLVLAIERELCPTEPTLISFSGATIVIDR
ncbi:MAG: hypothetical protein K1Y36_03880 [Blastocatellia bacterium]|nr:hypothetical protein [Blastocatellia bacterium]